MSSIVRITAIRDELNNDPLTLGYTGNDINDLALLLAENIAVDKLTMSASEIFEAIDATEWVGRTAEQKDDIRLILGLGDNIQISAGTKARAILQNALAGAATSIGNLVSISTRNVSRAEQLSFGNVHLGDIQHARVV